ncbi:unnamed protein product, partial [Orchesella dallaii]
MVILNLNFGTINNFVEFPLIWTILYDYRLQHVRDGGFRSTGEALWCQLNGEAHGLKTLSSKGDHLSVFMGPQQSVINLRTFSNGLVSIIIDYLREGDEEPLLTTMDGKALELALRKLGKDIKSVTLPPTKRGTPFDIYFPLSDGRLVEYDVDKLIYDERSPFQRVQIMHSKTFGNMLVLDGLPNLAESDLVYTESIMCRGTEDYKDKEILILGGGDGALLNELRKENPKHIIMVEIDEMVMKICKEHLRSACRDTLDSYIGKNYQ